VKVATVHEKTAEDSSLPSEALGDRRILIVEDSPVVAPFTAYLLADLGFEVVGPAPTMAAARELVDAEKFDAAIMDVHSRGERVFPLCDVLSERDVPFILTSGYADWQMPDKWQDAPRLQKPYTIDQVQEALAALFEGTD
jgi:DNA-binding response OmpR family regulator